jgi:hypothetical protein
VFAYVVLNVPRPEGAAAKSLHEELRNWVGEQLSPIAKPDEIRLTENLPKTRSGKIMRRLLRSIARGEEITQDMSTLENPAILEQLRGGAASPAAKDAAVPAKSAAPVPAKRTVRGKRAAVPKKATARSKAKKAAVSVRVAGRKQVRAGKRVKAGKRVRAVMPAKVSAKRGKQPKRMVRVKQAKRKVIGAKARGPAVKAVRRKPRGKK